MPTLELDGNICTSIRFFYHKVTPHTLNLLFRRSDLDLLLGPDVSRPDLDLLLGPDVSWSEMDLLLGGRRFEVRFRLALGGRGFEV